MDLENLEFIKKAFDCMLEGEISESVIYCDKALQKNPNDIVTLLDMAGYLQRLGRHEEALDIFDKVIAMYPDVNHSYSKRSEELYYCLQVPNWKSWHGGYLDTISVLRDKESSLERLKRYDEMKECQYQINWELKKMIKNRKLQKR